MLEAEPITSSPDVKRALELFRARPCEGLGLAVCPDEIRALDPNAESLWPIFLRRISLHFDSRGAIIEDEGRQAWVVRNFGIPSLIQRLAAASTELERARVWWRESVACSKGDSIPDLSTENMHLLNPFIVTEGLKFPDPRATRLVHARRGQEIERAENALRRRRGRPRKSEEEKRAAEAARQRAHRAKARPSWEPVYVTE